MVFPLKGWGVHGPSCSGVCGCFVDTRLGFVLGPAEECARSARRWTGCVCVAQGLPRQGVWHGDGGTRFVCAGTDGEPLGLGLTGGGGAGEQLIRRIWRILLTWPWTIFREL